jgi:spermidine synthase
VQSKVLYPTKSSTSVAYLSFLFLISGFAALIYQIVWQRTLFAAFGVNIESTTIIVCLFMFGLGVGSFVGGHLSDKFPNRAPLLFLISELGIGLFGLVSLPLIHYVTHVTLHGSLLTISIATFALLAIPTLFMGATLPILVNHLHRYLHNVGKTVGLLYCINTLGSAIACFITADFLFVYLGQQKSIYVAAGCNLIVGFLVWEYSRRIGRVELAPPTPQLQIANRNSKIFPLLLSALIGYISLSQEMLWMRAVSYMTGGRPTVFAHVLGAFLIGIAAGAFFAEKICSKPNQSPLKWIARLLLLSALTYYFGLFITAQLFTKSSTLGLVFTHFIVAATSFSLGSIFPILCHYATDPNQSVGLAVSRLYLANIIGAVLGPLLTGFVMMDLISTSHIILSLTLATLILAALTALHSRPLIIVALAPIVLLLFLHNRLYTDFLEKLHFQTHYDASLHYKYLVENRSGIVSVTEDFSGLSDTVYGGAIYDGNFNVDPWLDTNGITRAYLIAALHNDPKNILEIGLASGSWSRVLSAYEPVQHITSIEINPGYLKLIAHYSDAAPLLTDPKRTIHIDDGRRWLLRHPDDKFDFILQNTTFHWRDHATNLLSVEYFQLCKAHLNPGGVIYVNTTGNDDITFTAAAVFKHVVRVSKFIAFSDAPFSNSKEQIRANLMRFQINHTQVFADPKLKNVLERLSNHDLTDVAPAVRADQNLRLITDDNMRPEFHPAK